MFLSLMRIIKFSLQDISRNIWLTIATITILVLALLSVNTLLTVEVLSRHAIDAVKEKIDISLYLKVDASEEQITSLKTQISQMSKVKQVLYTSKADALRYFREKNKDNPEVLTALRELGRNPLSPSLVIAPNNVEEAPQLINEIKQIDSNIIESRDFADNTVILEKINDITKKISEVGLFIIMIFVFTSMLVAYNSIKVAIYTHRREIEIMRLVGASNSFIYLPFVLSAIIYALVSVVIIVIIFYPFLGILQPYLEVFFMDYNINIINYFLDNFWIIFGLQFLSVSIISVLSSWLAIRRYAKV
ncbi:MAG: permease-like cell division protein FtsX [Patescibacteria group bacterium]|jgi:cell division transport system permease protein